MIPALSVMIGMYIIARMLELASDAQAKTFVKLFAILTLVITAFAMIVILAAGAKIPSLQ